MSGLRRGQDTRSSKASHSQYGRATLGVEEAATLGPVLGLKAQ
jgi:hypothetical protein